MFTEEILKAGTTATHIFNSTNHTVTAPGGANVRLAPISAQEMRSSDGRDYRLNRRSFA